jgi:hypothetical protein
MVRHKVVAITAAAKSLASSLGEDGYVAYLSLQPVAANANPFFIGGPGVTTTDYGVRMEIPVTNIPSAAWPLDDLMGPLCKLSDVYIVGTATNNVSVFWVPLV